MQRVCTLKQGGKFWRLLQAPEKPAGFVNCSRGLAGEQELPIAWKWLKDMTARTSLHEHADSALPWHNVTSILVYAAPLMQC